MRKFILTLGSLAVATVASAQNAFQCVNPDVLNSLVFNARAESKLVVRRSMPDAVAGFRAPAGFTLIGSGVRGQNLSTVVAYKTTEEGGKAFTSLMDFLAAEGWRRETTPQTQQPTVSVAGPTPLAARVCRDGERRNLLVQEIGGVRYATIFGFDTNPPRACNAPVAQPPGFGNPMAAIEATRAQMPQFSFPATARMPAGGGLSLGSNDTFSSTTRIESPDSASNLATHLGRQLLSQGWRGDAEWRGALSTGSTWSRRGDAGQAYWGTLEILNLGEGTYEVGFSIERP